MDLLTEICSWLGTVLGLTGAYLVAKKKPVHGQIVWIPANVFWITYAILISNWNLVLLQVVYTILCFLGIYEYTRKKKQ
jgi:nicotinamide riboside transporter PnuC